MRSALHGTPPPPLWGGEGWGEVGPTVAATFADAARKWQERPFLHVTQETATHYQITAGALSYRDAAAQIDGTARRYQASGYGTGHRIGLMMGNRPAMLLHWFALNQLGVSVVPLNAELRPPELDYVMRHSGICLAVAARAHLANLRDGATTCPVITDDETAPAAPHVPNRDTPGLRALQ